MYSRACVLLCFVFLAAPINAQEVISASPVIPEAPYPLASAYGAIEYAYDDGSANTNIGPPSTFDPDMLWGNYFFTEEEGEIITEISVAFGSTFPSLDVVTFWLLDDPDEDGDPLNATSIASAEATPDVFGNTFFHVPITPTEVSGAFFVGASALLKGGADRPARVDTDARADRSWFCYAPDISAVIDDLASAPFCTRMDDTANVPFPGAFMVRALGEPVTTSIASELPVSGVSLAAPYPNPTTQAATHLSLTLQQPESVSVRVFDVLGQQVEVVYEGPLSAGSHSFRLDSSKLATGVYVIKALSDHGVSTQTVTILD